jgi:hypothetical protein
MPAGYPQQPPTFQQPPPFYAPLVFNPTGQFQQTTAFLSFQQIGAPVLNANLMKNKRKKKKNGGPASVPPPHMPYVQPQLPFLPSIVPPSGGGADQAGPSAVDQQAADGSDVVASKLGKCWKCSVDSDTSQTYL